MSRSTLEPPRDTAARPHFATSRASIRGAAAVVSVLVVAGIWVWKSSSPSRPRPPAAVSVPATVLSKHPLQQTRLEHSNAVTPVFTKPFCAQKDFDWTESERERIRQLAEQNPSATAAWAANLPAGAARDFTIDVVSIAWGGSDPGSAALWAASLSCKEEQQRALAGIAGEAVRVDPQFALELASNLPDAPARDTLLGRAITEWGARNPAAAASYARDLSDAALRSTALAGIATIWGDRDPVAAARLAVQELPPGRLQDNTVVAIVQRWAAQAPDAATRWVKQFPEGDLKTAAEAALASRQLHPLVQTASLSGNQRAPDLTPSCGR